MRGGRRGGAGDPEDRLLELHFRQREIRESYFRSRAEELDALDELWAAGGLTVQRVRCNECSETGRISEMCTFCRGSGLRYSMRCRYCTGSGIEDCPCPACDSRGYRT